VHVFDLEEHRSRQDRALDAPNLINSLICVGVLNYIRRRDAQGSAFTGVGAAPGIEIGQLTKAAWSIPSKGSASS